MSGTPSEPSKSPARIAEMFDAIAIRYDLLNRVLSAGFDRGWRSRALDALGMTGHERLLDVCTGTADVVIAARQRPNGAAAVIGVDFAAEMLRVGLQKVRRTRLEKSVCLIQADATELPLASESVEAATVAFGIRNVERPSAACAEVWRVLRAGGRLAILEFGIPSRPPLRHLYVWYFTTVLPRIGRAVSGHRAAYSYLPRSVETFPAPEAFCRTLAAAGFDGISATPLTGGIVYLYCATKPRLSPAPHGSAGIIQ